MVTGSNNSSAQGSTTATVADAPLNTSQVTISTLIQTPFSGVVAFFQTNNSYATSGDFKAFINWGELDLDLAGDDLFERLWLLQCRRSAYVYGRWDVTDHRDDRFTGRSNQRRQLLRAIDRLILGILGNGSVELVVRSHLGIPHGAAIWRRLLREVCLPFLRPYPILAAVMDGDIPSRPSSL